MLAFRPSPRANRLLAALHAGQTNRAVVFVDCSRRAERERAPLRETVGETSVGRDGEEEDRRRGSGAGSEGARCSYCTSGLLRRPAGQGGRSLCLRLPQAGLEAICSPMRLRRESAKGGLVRRERATPGLISRACLRTAKEGERAGGWCVGRWARVDARAARFRERVEWDRADSSTVEAGERGRAGGEAVRQTRHTTRPDQTRDQGRDEPGLKEKPRVRQMLRLLLQPAARWLRRIQFERERRANEWRSSARVSDGRARRSCSCCLAGWRKACRFQIGLL